MAAQVTKLIDSTKRVVYRLISDVSEAKTLKIDAGSLNFALNTNNKILGTGTDRKSKYKLHLKRITYDVKSDVPGAYVLFSTDGDLGNNIITCSGHDDKRFSEGGDSFMIDCANVGNTTGNIFLTTIGFSGNCAYTVILDFKKEGGDFDQGQTADPKAFNR